MSLASCYPVTPVCSNGFVGVAFQGCAKPVDLPSMNIRSQAKIQALFSQAAVETPALSIYEGSGRTGGIMIHKPYDRKLSDSPVLFGYQFWATARPQEQSSENRSTNNNIVMTGAYALFTKIMTLDRQVTVSRPGVKP
ncbi:MAG: hypothetical protein KME03_07545 [Aphanocapsa lilacina HA4352-LM1]|nr:hypothetical protein [Aphanocapsa lilacina HA4352-LM1]